VTPRLTVGAADELLDKRLSDELDVVNAAAVPGSAAVELTVRGTDEHGEKQGYREIFRWDGVPVEGEADVHLRKDL
jgi:hypothetical protein